MKRTLFISTLLIAALAMAQGPSTALTNEVKTQTIQELEKVMREQYAYPDAGKKAADLLDAQLKSHGYDAIADGKEFAKKLTDDMRTVCKDAHLHLNYSEAVLPVRANRGEPSPEEIKANEEFNRYANAGFTKVERLDGNIGYISFRNFMDVDAAKRPVKAAMEFLANTDALIIDIRQNGGGSPETVQLICSYFFGDKPIHLNDLVHRDGKRDEFWTLAKVEGPRYTKDIYVLTSKRTGSAAEEFSYNLKNLKRATIIGEPTWGGANPGGMYRLNDHFAVFVPHAHAENPITKSNWEGAGVQPDIAVDPTDALNVAYQMAIKKEIETSANAERKPMLEQILKELETKKTAGG